MEGVRWSGGAGRRWNCPVLQPDGPLAGLDRAAVVDVLSRRTDAWTYRGRRV
jgi:hypothetical protein